MGKIIDNEQFFTQLNQMYAGTKKWGTVRIVIKRCKLRVPFFSFPLAFSLMTLIAYTFQ